MTSLVPATAASAVGIESGLFRGAVLNGSSLADLHKAGGVPLLSARGSASAVPIALQSLHAEPTLLLPRPAAPQAAERHAVPPAAAAAMHSSSSSSITSCIPPLPELLFCEGLPCETTMAQLFGPPESSSFRSCRPLLAVLLASLDATVGQLIPAGTIPAAPSLTEPEVASNVQGPPMGLLAAALNMDVLCLHMLLTTHSTALRHLISYTPSAELTNDTSFEVVSSPPLTALFRGISTGAAGFFSPKLRSSAAAEAETQSRTHSLAAPPPVDGHAADGVHESGDSSPQQEARRALSETQVQPTGMCMRVVCSWYQYKQHIPTRVHTNPPHSHFIQSSCCAAG